MSILEWHLITENDCTVFIAHYLVWGYYKWEKSVDLWFLKLKVDASDMKFWMKKEMLCKS